MHYYLKAAIVGGIYHVEKILRWTFSLLQWKYAVAPPSLKSAICRKFLVLSEFWKQLHIQKFRKSYWSERLFIDLIILRLFSSFMLAVLWCTLGQPCCSIDPNFKWIYLWKLVNDILWNVGENVGFWKYFSIWSFPCLSMFIKKGRKYAKSKQICRKFGKLCLPTSWTEF